MGQGGVDVENEKLKKWFQKPVITSLWVKRQSGNPSGGGKSLNSKGQNCFSKSNIFILFIESIFINFIFKS